MIVSVTLYYDTGLGPGNSMDDISKLGLFTNRTFNDVAVKQNIMLESARIAATFNDVKGADYCKIGDMAYYITSLVMLNDNVAELLLQPDFATTIGVSGLTVTSGWLKRRHYSETEDQMFANLFDEPFSPANEPVLERGTVIDNTNTDHGGTGGDPSARINIIISSIDLTKTSNEAKKYIENTENLSCIVPQLPSMISSSENTIYKSECVSPEKTSIISMTNAFNVDNSTIRTGIEGLRSLGIESAISACYTIPDPWVHVTYGDDGLIARLDDRSSIITSDIANGYNIPGYTPLNNKLFTGQFNKIRVFSMSSGDSEEFRIEDIIDSSQEGGGRIRWKIYADCKFNGAPGCKPNYYRNVENTDTMCAIIGSHWQQTPFMYTQASGFGFTSARGNIEWQRRTDKALASAGTGLAELALSMGSAVTVDRSLKQLHLLDRAKKLKDSINLNSVNTAVKNVASSDALSNIIDTEMNNRLRVVDTYERKIEGYGTVAFPEAPYLADYIGNSFYDIRTRLSDDDSKRFDKFLSAYGYAVDENFAESGQGIWFNRQKHNYIQATDVTLKKQGVPMFLMKGLANDIENGLRVWHVAPNTNDLYYNPKVHN